MSIIDEFKTFALKGNMVDLAIGVIIGASFGKIVNSLVNDVLMPPIGLLIGGVDFSKLSVPLKKSSEGHPAVEIKVGSFINTVIDFLIVAFVIFMVIKMFNRLRASKAAQEPEPVSMKCPQCLMEIPNHAKRCGHCCADLTH